MVIKIVALPTPLAATMQERGTDAYGNALHPERQDAYGNPCRHCLRRARPGESLVLFSYSPFERQNPYKETGPVFVHAHRCERYARTNEFPEDFAGGPIVLRAYDREQRIARVAVVVDDGAPQRAEELLGDPSIAYVHARSYTHGCFLFGIERAA
jgi:hypothetical protein